MTIGNIDAMIYELPVNEKFVDFLNYNSLNSIRFNQPKINIDVCSHIVFLTKKRKRFIVNVMLIDPYLKKEAFMLF